MFLINFDIEQKIFLYLQSNMDVPFQKKDMDIKAPPNHERGKVKGPVAAFRRSPEDKGCVNMFLLPKFAFYIIYFVLEFGVIILLIVSQFYDFITEVLVCLTSILFVLFPGTILEIPSEFYTLTHTHTQNLKHSLVSE